MLALRDTSRGQILFELGPAGRIFGETAAVQKLDVDGLPGERSQWNSKKDFVGSKTLADAIVHSAELPQEEAEELADAILSEWRKRRSDEVSTGKELTVFGLLALAFGLIPVLILGTAVWLFLTLI